MPGYRGHIDLVEFSPDFTLIWGWVANPNGSSDKATLTVHCGDVRSTVSYPYFREDLVAAGIENGLGGFMAYFPKSINKNKIFDIKFQINDTDDVDINRDNFSTREFEPRAGFKGAGKAGISGWIFDPRFERNDPCSKLRLDGGIDLDIKKFDLVKTDVFDRFEFHISLDDVVLLTRSFQKGNVSYLGDKSHKIELLYHDKIISVGTLEVRTSVIGRVEEINSEFIRGWAINKEMPNEPVMLDVMFDGSLYQTIKADVIRKDLIKNNISESGGGFVLSMPSSSAGKNAEISVSVIVSRSGKILPLINKNYPESISNISVMLKPPL